MSGAACLPALDIELSSTLDTTSLKPAGMAVTKQKRPTPEQQSVFDGVCLRCRSRNQTIVVVDGLAGTGKSTLAAQVVLAHPGARVCCPTGKAADALRRKSGMTVRTIHGTIYRLLDAEEAEDRRPTKLNFEPKYADGELRGGIIVVDESSMVDSQMADDLIRTGAHIVTFGDPGQLPPINGPRYFDPADYTLREIHRQALESAIIRQAHRVRVGEPYVNDGRDFRVIDTVSDRDLFEADTILCYKNIVRQKINRRMRVLHGKTGYPRMGEPLCA